jgi:hypothetical protein
LQGVRVGVTLRAWTRARARTRPAPARPRRCSPVGAVARVQERLDVEFYPRILRGIDAPARDALRTFAELGGVAVTRQQFLERSGAPWHESHDAVGRLMHRGIVDVASSRIYSISTPGMIEFLHRSGDLGSPPSPDERSAAL